MPMVCINVLCSLHSSHHLLQFHIFLCFFFLCSSYFMFFFCKLNEMMVARIAFTVFLCFTCLRWCDSGKRKEMDSLLSLLEEQ